MVLANRIKKLRETLNMSKEEIAKGVVSYSHYCNIEAGRFVPSQDILFALEKKLKVPKYYLVHYYKKDNELEQQLLTLKVKLDNLLLEDAKGVLNNINQTYFLIQSIYQETFYYLLESYYYYRTGEIDKAFTIFEREVVPLLNNVDEDNLYTDLKEVYYYMLAVINFHQEDYYRSYKYFLKQEFLVKSNIQRAILNYNLALIHSKLNDAKTGINFAKTALNLHLQERKWDKVAETDNLLGVLYWESNNYVKAKEHFQKAFEIIEQNQIESLKPRVLHNLGLVTKSNNEYEQSITYLTESLLLKKKMNNQDLVVTYILILESYIDLYMFDKANSLLEEAKRFSKSKIEEYLLQIIEAKLHLQQKSNDEYEKSIKKALTYFEENKLWKLLSFYAEEFAEYYFKKRRYKQASLLYKTVALANKNLMGGMNYQKGK
ncbi:hypothetical protein BHF71_09265 [Vulcanibacillus modesticaldus]|uniref:HTH cro/C1-type domain-containing protein n=1 Tax=Vulcanibacillus modesticaldus TaxID=337097 RepID=A0A1D2YU74_9BACI|nr:helix-turn-helix transcriptional regulator [Vulcanibacillus modesticaldus]OEF99258.1 hypothetical protein BHF71_09265 [Vulcanibacillus modesticaldus]